MKFNNLIAISCLTALLIFNACTDEKNGACDAGHEFVTHTVLPTPGGEIKPFSYPFANDAVFYYSNSAGNGKVQFFSAYSRVNVCTKEHLKVDYAVFPSTSPQPLPMKIYGEAYWSFFSDELILVSGNINPGPEGYKGSREIGLKQAFGDGPGDIDFYLTVEFDSQGSYSADSLYFRTHIDLMSIEFKVDNYL